MEKIECLKVRCFLDSKGDVCEKKVQQTLA